MARYYWVRVDCDRFDREDMKILEMKENGAEYILFWMKLMLKAAQAEDPGELRFNADIPYDERMLSKVLGTDIDVVRTALIGLQKMGLVERGEDGTLFVKEAAECVGSRSDSADRMVKWRKRHPVTKILSHSDEEESPSCHYGASHVTGHHVDVDVSSSPSSQEEREDSSGARGEGGVQRREAKGKKEVVDGELYHKVEVAFLKRNGDKFTDYKREGAALHQLIGRARARDGEKAEDLLVSVCKQFWKLKQSGDKFWSGQPFTPSTLNTVSIWDRVLESMRSEEVDPELQAIMDGRKV
jgi:predicted phage replisome organizer